MLSSFPGEEGGISWESAWGYGISQSAGFQSPTSHSVVLDKIYTCSEIQLSYL